MKQLIEFLESLIVITLVLAGIGGLAFNLFNLWRGGRVIHSRTSILPNLFLYGLFAAGVYFIGRYVLTGAV